MAKYAPKKGFVANLLPSEGKEGVERWKARFDVYGRQTRSAEMTVQCYLAWIYGRESVPERRRIQNRKAELEGSFSHSSRKRNHENNHVSAPHV